MRNVLTTRAFVGFVRARACSRVYVRLWGGFGRLCMRVLSAFVCVRVASSMSEFDEHDLSESLYSLPGL